MQWYTKYLFFVIIANMMIAVLAECTTADGDQIFVIGGRSQAMVDDFNTSISSSVNYTENSAKDEGILADVSAEFTGLAYWINMGRVVLSITVFAPSATNALIQGLFVHIYPPFAIIGDLAMWLSYLVYIVFAYSVWTQQAL
ncbi:hypothetical protein [Methanococcus maripaludis]|uniref:Uncharacterized protein n=1 Tax=Methanococcus maripaludis TaxID=39152 RepID=A0A7J9PMN9_METMI|nr:hypothetical protein [Methanococcus maripaludis]MBA2863990.1 hypothetical protein [Methanococcus maripaludis]